MEGFIPVLIELAYFILQAYTGYQKEKEKAAKRQLGKPVAQKPTTQRPAERRSATRKPIQPPIEQPIPTSEPIYPDYKEQSYELQEPYGKQSYEPRYEQKRYMPDMPPSLLDEYKRLSEYAEIEKVKAKKKKLLQNQNQNQNKIIRPKLEQLAMQDIDDLDPEEYEIDFDIREAILAKAILDRPYS